MTLERGCLMYIVSNKDMEDIIRYVEAYRLSVDVKTCDIKTYNQMRMAGLLLRRLKAKQPLEKPYQASPSKDHYTPLT